MRDWLRKIRKEKCMSAKQISELCSISRSYYDMIETNTRNPSVTLAQKLGELLDFDWTKFFEVESEVRVDDIEKGD